MTKKFLCLTIRFLDPVPTFHGRDEGGNPEWPPSPLRVFQALVAAAAARWRGSNFADRAVPALNWLATLVPDIVAPAAQIERTAYRMYVPHNAGDLMTSAWSRGDTEASMAKHRVEKDVWPTRLLSEGEELSAVRYLYAMPETGAELGPLQQVIADAAHSVTHLGRGVDMVTADTSILDSDAVARLPGERWHPTMGGSSHLRIPQDDTLTGLNRRYEDYLQRIGPAGFNPVKRLSEFSLVSYQSSAVAIERPFIIFELLRDDDSRFSYPQEKLIHIAGMVRHLAIEAMTNSPPASVADDWVSSYVAGHVKDGDVSHRQFSYLPLPSVGHEKIDPSVRRMMIAAPPGDAGFLKHLARLLVGRQLKPTAETRIGLAPTLVAARMDNVARSYVRQSTGWASVTPVILPGYDDRKPAKTRRLIEKALLQAGIDQPCEFDWGPFSHFPKSLSAHKYDRKQGPNGYIRPDHLLNQTAVHLKLHFAENSKMRGPLAIGSGRHCGLGVMAAID